MLEGGAESTKHSHWVCGTPFDMDADTISISASDFGQVQMAPPLMWGCPKLRQPSVTKDIGVFSVSLQQHWEFFLKGTHVHISNQVLNFKLPLFGDRFPEVGNWRALRTSGCQALECVHLVPQPLDNWLVLVPFPAIIQTIFYWGTHFLSPCIGSRARKHGSENFATRVSLQIRTSWYHRHGFCPQQCWFHYKVGITKRGRALTFPQEKGHESLNLPIPCRGILQFDRVPALEVLPCPVILLDSRLERPILAPWHEQTMGGLAKLPVGRPVVAPRTNRHVDNVTSVHFCVQYVEHS